jgi:hypothetical protein
MVRGIADCIRAAGLSLGLVTAAAGCSNTPTASQCEALLAHVVDLEVKEGGGHKDLPANMKADLDRQRKELEAHVRDAFLQRCRDSLPAAFVACGLQARTKADYAECEKQE